MDADRTKYAILTKRTEIKIHLIPKEFLDGKERILLEAGTLLAIVEQPSKRKDVFVVRILDYFNGNSHPQWENLYDCPSANVRKVTEDFWPYVIAIPDPEERLKFHLNEEQCKHIAYLKVNDMVAVSGIPFKKTANYDCIIRYIGMVQEIGPGYYFGLELLHLDNGYSPQSEDIPFVTRYIACDPTLSLIVPANFVYKIQNDVKKKFSAREVLTDTIGKACLAIGLTNNRQTSVRRRKSKSPKSAHSGGGSDINNIHVSDADCVMDRKTDSLKRRDRATNTNFAEKSLAQTKDASSSCSDSDRDHKIIQSNDNLITLHDDVADFVESYEKSLERKHDVDQQQNNIPCGILKQSKTTKKKSSTTGGGLDIVVKPTTIMSLEDRDIVVIDKADIKESTKNASEVIVVDNPRQQKEVDLADLLGSNWPSNAGDAAQVLNSELHNKTPSNSTHSSSNSSVSSFNTRLERNKSANPLSHILINRSLDRKNKENWPKLEGPTKIDASNKLKEKKLKNIPDPLYDNANGIANQVVSLASPEDEFIPPSPLSEIPGTNMGVGSMVEVTTDVCEDLYGVIRWVGMPQGSKAVMVGVELEDEPGDKPLTLTDGTYNGQRLFKCPDGRALIVNPNQCLQDRRFIDIDVPHSSSKLPKQVDTKMFGQVECPSVSGSVPPLKIFNIAELDEICGKFKGIQGHHNSCYLDATLFAMFTFTSVFDSLLFRPAESEDISNYEEVQSVLREDIVNPLRKNVFVRADRVMKLRQLLEKLSSVTGLTSEEKDPEEFLNSLLAQIMRADPFLKLSSGQDAFFYQLFVEKDERLSFPSVQQLFEQSFLASDIKLKEVPSCLIIQMPRFGKNFKMYPRILPSQVLDVTDIIEDSPRQCSVCGKLAEFECRECFGILQCGVGLESTAFCKKCLETVHSHAKRANHAPKEISVPQDFKIMAEHLTVPRVFMELFAVVCIETSHYVAFVKAGSGLDAPWCFFDSMADRKGEQNGYNIPEMISVPDLPQWLSEDGARSIHEAASNDKMLPEHAKRLLCDAYMCMYQSTDVMMYR